MPTNSEARVDIRLKINPDLVQQEVASYIDKKSNVIRAIYQDAGDLYKRMIANRIPSLGLGELNRSFRYRTTTSKSGIRLTVGILNKTEFGAVHDFLRFWLYGTKRHWVSLKAHPELAQWAIEKGIVTQEGDSFYSNSPKYTNDGMPYKTKALKVGIREHYSDVVEIKETVLNEIIHELHMIL